MKRRRNAKAKALLYKVVEISNVDEHSLERTLNDWVVKGWAFDGVQFAMRESSKRPSMAFVFFTRVGRADATPVARSRLSVPAPAERRTSAYERLRELASGGDDA